MLAWASVAGQEFTLPLLQEVAGLDEDQLLEVVDGAVAARVLTPYPSLGQEVYAFVDELIRDVLYEGIGPARRRRYHLKVGQGIEKVHGRRLEQHYDALAHHFLEGNDLHKSLEYAIKAGERSYAISSWERATRHLETALELLGELPEDLPRQAQVLELLADLDMSLGRPGLRYMQGALELYTRLGDKRKAARMHRIIGTSWATGMVGPADWGGRGLAHLGAAVKLLDGEPDSIEKAFAYDGLTFGLWGTLDLERAVHFGKEALGIAERLRDPNQVTYACTELGVVLAFLGELTQAEEYAERSWDAALQGQDSFGIARACHLPIMVWSWRNDKRWLEQWLKRCLEYRRRFHMGRYDLAMYGLSALGSALSGRPEEATEALRHSEEAASQHPYLTPWLVYYAGAAHAILDDWAQGSRLLADSLEAGESGHLPWSTPNACLHYGRFLLASGDTARAEEVLTKGYTLAYEKGSLVQELNLLPLLCELHLKTGRLEQAELDLKRAQEILARRQPWRGLAAPIHLAEGMLATARGNWTEAEQAFGQALEMEGAYGFPYNEGRALFEWGEMYLKRNSRGDREKGMELLDQALAIYQRCAARNDVEKVLARKELLRA